jgi:hypothetical protein
MALNNLQIKVYPETEQDFNTLMAESDSSTKGKFLELLIENFKNPKVKTVFEVPLEVQNKLKDLQDEVNELLHDRESQEYSDATVLNELSTYRGLFNDIKTIFGPYLLICKRDNFAADYVGLFKLMLDQLHKGNAFILDQNDISYIKNHREE